MSEFSIINDYFKPLAQDHPAAQNLGNDAAVLDIPQGKQLVVTSDTLNEGIHFPENAAPDVIAHKALRSNLSDLAAMGAQPLSYQLCIGFPKTPSEEFLKPFTAALLQDQKQFGIFCSGGDTTSTQGKLSITITAMGVADTGKAWGRDGAQDGDALVLTHPVGDAWIGLQILQNKLKTENDAYFLNRYYKPTPRFLDTRDFDIHAAIDISDGLIADLQHICNGSQISAYLHDEILFSPQAQKLLQEGRVTKEDLLTGGDDYELLLALPEVQVNSFLKHHPTAQKIGTFRKGNPQLCDQNGKPLDFKKTGWTHF